MSCHLMSRHVMSSHVLSCHVTSCHVTSCHVMSCHVMSSHVCHVMSSHVFSRVSRLVMSCHVMSRHLARESCSRIFLPSLLNSSIMAAGWPRRGFRNRGPVWERRSRCGAACTASVRVGLVRIFSTWASFCVAGCGNRACWRCAGSVPAALCGGDWVPGAFLTRVANVRFAWQAAGIVRAGSMSGACPRAVSAALCRGDWVQGVSRARMILCAATCVSRGRRGSSDALMCSGRRWTVDPRGRRNESYAVAKIAGFRGPVRARVGRCEIVAGAGNPWICGCELGADVSWNAAAGCVGRVVRSSLCRGTQWQALTMGVGRVARLARAALCHGDCCWARRLGAAVPWGLLLGVLRGCRCAVLRVLGIADQGMVWVAPCHQDW